MRNVTTKYEPIYDRFVFGLFCFNKDFSIFFEKNATNDTSVGSYGVERGNEGKPHPFRSERGCIK